MPGPRQQQDRQRRLDDEQDDVQSEAGPGPGEEREVRVAGAVGHLQQARRDAHDQREQAGESRRREQPPIEAAGAADRGQQHTPHRIVEPAREHQREGRRRGGEEESFHSDLRPQSPARRAEGRSDRQVAPPASPAHEQQGCGVGQADAEHQRGDSGQPPGHPLF